MRKTKSTIKPLNLLNGYDDTNLNNMDFVLFDNDGELSFQGDFDIDGDEFNYHLNAIIKNYKTLINLGGSKTSLIQDLSRTIH